MNKMKIYCDECCYNFNESCHKNSEKKLPKKYYCRKGNVKISLTTIQYYRIISRNEYQ